VVPSGQADRMSVDAFFIARNGFVYFEGYQLET
jgi:hypothetical protein